MKLYALGLLAVVLVVVALTPLSANANTTIPPFRIDIGLKSVTGGPAPKAVVGPLVPVTLVYRNTGTKPIARLKASFSPAEIIMKSKLRYSKAEGFYAPHLTANWLFKNVKPGTAEKFIVWLKIPPRTTTAPGYTVAVEGRVLGADVFVSRLISLKYVVAPNQ